ncbi:CBP4-domain-containing protein [Nemania diffusa]|nr:CBP4-domain-containing protein [Nemania diffusa]
MAAKSGRLAIRLKMLAVGGAVCVGGPAFVMWVQPTDEELFKRYSPELQKKSLEGRYERQKEFDDFVTKLKEFSKSDKPIWTVQEEAIRKLKEESLQQDFKNVEGAKAIQEAMRKEAGLAKGAGESQSTEKSKLQIAEEAKARQEVMRKEAGLLKSAG